MNFRSVGPMLDRDHELGEVLGGVGDGDDGRAWEVGSPDGGVGVGVEEHEVGGPVGLKVSPPYPCLPIM